VSSQIQQPNQPTNPRHACFTKHTHNPAPLSARQLWALIVAVTRELTWGLPGVAREVRRWRAIANNIDDPWIREDALNALREQRPHIDGAALFAILPRTRNPHLLRLLVAYEIIWDFLDNINERSAAVGVTNGLQLHLALIDALDPQRPISNYYKFSPDCNDCGYLRALVTDCRAHCARLPSYNCVRPSAIREAMRGQVCAINHDPDPQSREASLKTWATHEFPFGHEALWFELTAAASTNLTIFALLALASEPTCPATQLKGTSVAYYPWISVMTAMLDSYVDQLEDTSTGDHSYLGHYSRSDFAIQRILLLMRRCLREARRLTNGEKHVVIAACMFAMYLSKSSALTPAMHETTKRLVASGGSLTRLLHPILRLWRTVYGLRSA
jgi:tetraprenyl-beta-curcumene synthase